MANLAVELLAKVWVRTWRDKICFAQYTCNTSSVTVNRATFSHWRRLAIRIVSLKTKLRTSAFDNFHRMLKYKNVYEIWLMGFVSLLQWEKVAAVG